MRVSVKGKFLSEFPQVVKDLVSDVNPHEIPAGSNKVLELRCSNHYTMCPNSRCSNGCACPKYDCKMEKRHQTNASLFGWQRTTEPTARIVRERPLVPDIDVDDTQEIWQDPPVALGISGYQVSNLGNIKNIKTGRIRKHTVSQDGYLCKSYAGQDGLQKRYYDHVVVARTFIPNPNDLPTVNHINTVRNDNRVINLEWLSRSEQNYKENQETDRIVTGHRPIEQLDMEGNFIRSWEKAMDAATALGASKQNIGAVCKGRRESCKGFLWRYQNPNPNLTGEIWKPLPVEFKGCMVSNLGRFRRANGGEYAHFGTLHRSGYFGIKIQEKSYQVHRLVAIAFIPNDMPLMRDQVNHKDGNRGNNQLDNLEWVTGKENILHAHTLKRKRIENEYRCTVYEGCRYSTDHREDLDFHEGVVHKAGYHFFCDYCPTTLKTKVSLQQHTNSIHLGVLYSCDHCATTFKSKFRRRVG